MISKVRLSHSNKSRAHIGRAKVREGKEIYRKGGHHSMIRIFMQRTNKPARDDIWRIHRACMSAQSRFNEAVGSQVDISILELRAAEMRLSEALRKERLGDRWKVQP